MSAKGWRSSFLLISLVDKGDRTADVHVSSTLPEKWHTARPSLTSSGPPVAICGSANRLTEGKYSRCGTVHLENVPPVGQRGSVMICLFCDRKIRWWQKKAFSVVSANHYHWACLWDAGRNNHQKRNDEKIATPSRPQHSPGIYGSPSRLIGTTVEMRRNSRPARAATR